MDTTILIEKKNDIKANRFTLRCICIAIIIYLSAWFLNFLGIFIIDSKIMNSGIIGTVIFFATSHIIAYLIGLDKAFTKYFVLFCFVGILTYYSTILSYHTTMFMLFPIICSVQYYDKKITAYIYILTCIGFFVSVLVGFNYGVCDANMVFITVNKTSVFLEKMEAGLVSINKDFIPLILYYVLPRCLIVAAFIPMQNYITTEIQKKTERETEARRLLERDALTGLYNRNKYLSMIKEHYPNCKNVAVIYCDLNNLKEVNDSRGHEFGDMLIIGMANVLKKFDSKNCFNYRIGGDEYVTILENPEPGQAKELERGIKQEAVGKDLGKGIILSVAVGLAEGSADLIDSVISKADEMMYEEKARMRN